MLKFKLVIVAFCLINSMLINVNALSDDFLVNVFAEVCPQVDICAENVTSAEIKPNGRFTDGSDKISCCKGCSCHPDCRHHMNCCHGQHITDADGRKHDPVCTHMRVGSPGQKFGAQVPAFYTIVSEPAGGCINTKPFETISGETLLPSCGSQPVTPWGDFYPVLSKTSNKIYKNEACALCHRVNDSDPFTPYLECDKITLDRGYTYHMSEYLQVFENNEMLEFCQIEYRHSYLPVLQAERCLVDMVTNCTLDDITPASDNPFSINLTILACEYGYHAPIVLSNVGYKNIFCAACNGYLKSVTGYACLHDSFLWRDVGDKTKFTLLLDSRFIQPPQATLKEDEVLNPEVCLVKDLTSPETICRKLLCPSGMVRRQGACVFISKNWFTSGLAIDVRLKLASGNIPVSDDNFEPFFDEIIRNNPWQGGISWTVAAISYKVKGGLIENFFLVRLLTSSEGIIVKDMMNSIKETMSKSWVVNVNGVRYQFEQAFLEYELAYESLKNPIPSWKSALKSKPGHSYSGMDSEIWKTRGYWSLEIALARYPTYITKLYLCEQIELQPEEFDFEVDIFLIKNKLNGRLLFDKEFILMKTDHGNDVARVCLSDAPFFNRCTVVSLEGSAAVACISLYWGYFIVLKAHERI